MAINCSVLYNDIIIDVSRNSVKWCCRQDQSSSLSEYNPSEYFNNPLLRDIRDALGNDVKHPACQMCWDVERYGGKSWRNVYGNEPNTISDPALLDRQVTRIEIKFDLTCDLACIYCGPWNSTTWEKENERTGFVQPYHRQENPDGLSKIQDILREIGRFNRFLMIEFTGGEPFLSKHFTYENLENLLGMYMMHNIENARLILKFTSNANTPAKVLSKTQECLEKLKNLYPTVDIIVALSLESTGKYTEISRYLSDWETIDANVRSWVSKPWLTPMISASFNALTLPDLKNFMVYLADVFTSNKRPIMISSNVVHWPVGLNPTVLPKSFEKYLDGALVQIENTKDLFDHSTPQGYDNLENCIKNLKETLGTEMHNKPHLKRFTDYCMRARNINLREVNPDLYGYVYGDQDK